MNKFANFNLRVDGSVIPPPSGYSFTESDLVENSERNANGFARWDVIRTNVGQISLTWDRLDGDRLQQVISAIRGKKEFSCTFFNPLTGSHETRTFYSGDRAAELTRYISAVNYFATLTVPFIEV